MSKYCINIRSGALLMGGALAVAGCSGIIEKRAAESTYSIMQGSRRAMQRTSDVELARLASPGGLVQLESFHLAYPKHRGFKSMLAEGYCQYAVGFAYPEWEGSVVRGDASASERQKQRTLGLLSRCIELGVGMLGASWRQSYESGTLAESLPSASEKDIPGLGWIALGMANTIAIDPFAKGRTEQLDVVESILDRIVALDERYNDATAHTMLGALQSSRPRFLGGDPDAGLRHFARARELTGRGALMNEVILARTFAVAKGDRELFRSTLRAVVDADTNTWPERRLANALAVEKARFYLENEERIFGGPAVAQRNEIVPTPTSDGGEE